MHRGVFELSIPVGITSELTAAVGGVSTDSDEMTTGFSYV